MGKRPRYATGKPRNPLLDNRKLVSVGKGKMWMGWQLDEYQQVKQKHGRTYADKWFYAKHGV